MENKSHAVAAGLFVVLLGAALALVGVWFGKDNGQKLTPYIVTTTFDVSGLKPEAPVRYRGVEVGKVRSIRLDAQSRGLIMIEIGVDPATPVTGQTYAQLGYLGVTGITFVSLQDRSSGEPLLESSEANPARIAMKPSLMDSGESLLGSVGALVDRASSLLSEENRDRAGRLLANAEQASARLGQLAERMEPVLRQMPALIGDARGALTAVKTAAADVGHAADSVGATALRLDTKLDTLNAVAANVGEVGSTARVIQEETVPRLNALADGLNRQTRALDRVINTLSEQPQSLVFGNAPPQSGPGEPGYRAGAAQ